MLHVLNAPTRRLPAGVQGASTLNNTGTVDISQCALGRANCTLITWKPDKLGLPILNQDVLPRLWAVVAIRVA